jgi:hypothetical protein
MKGIFQHHLISQFEDVPWSTTGSDLTSPNFSFGGTLAEPFTRLNQGPF